MNDGRQAIELLLKHAGRPGPWQLTSSAISAKAIWADLAKLWTGCCTPAECHAAHVRDLACFRGMAVRSPNFSRITYLSACSLHLFKQRQSRTHMQKGWSEKMPDFVRRLEDALYRTAHSKVRPELKSLQATHLFSCISPHTTTSKATLWMRNVIYTFEKPTLLVLKASRLFSWL